MSEGALREARAFCESRGRRARRRAPPQVASLQFNVLVTTYEYIMRDRARLAKARRSSRRAFYGCALVQAPRRRCA